MKPYNLELFKPQLQDIIICALSNYKNNNPELPLHGNNNNAVKESFPWHMISK